MSFTVIFLATLIVLATLAAGITPNRYIKRRLLVSILLALAGIGFELAPQVGAMFHQDVPDVLHKVATLLLAIALINSLVVLLLNPFRAQGVSERWPAIVQDSIVLAGALVCGLLAAREEFVALGVASTVVIGLALRDTLGNLFAGLALQTEKPYRVGDWVEVADETGRVVQATWRATKIQTKSANFVIIPNSMIARDSITNFSMPTTVTRLERRVHMGHQVPPNLFKKIALEAMSDVPEILEDPQPSVLTHEYDDYAILYRCRFWIDDYRRSEPISDKFMTLFYYRLERAGVPLPVPVRDVRMRQMEVPEKELALDARRAFVNRVDLFAPLPETVKELIASSLEAVTFAAGESIVRHGEAGDSMFFVHQGGVRIVLSQGDRESNVATLESGQFFGEMTLLTGEPRTATAVAVGDVEAFLLHKNSFKRILEDNPYVLKQISTVMAERRDGLALTEKNLDDVEPDHGEKAESFLKRVHRFFGLS